MSDDEDFSDNEEEEQGDAKCLFCAETKKGVQLILEHCKTEHNFDFAGFKKTHFLDFYTSIRLVNFIRSAVKAGQDQITVLKNLQTDSNWTVDEKYLQPVLEDDAFIFNMDEDEDDFDGLSLNDRPQSTQSLQAENEYLKDQLAEMHAKMQQMKEIMTRITLDDAKKKDQAEMGCSFPSGFGKQAGDDEKKKKGEKKQGLQKPVIEKTGDEGYFESYSNRYIHEVMLKDTVRTCAYRDFMYKNKHLFEGKVVLDIGCGTGILSMFAATAGAKQVIGIDMADIIDKARLIVKDNKLDHIITLVKGKVEEVTIPVDKVDLIISEWMGYFLLYESMLPSVLYARDKWLVPGGGVYPNRAIMYVAGIECTEYKDSKLEFWKNVYGFDMSVLIADTDRYVGCTVDTIEAKALITEQEVIATFDCMTCSAADLEFTHDFNMKVETQESLDAFAVWFDTDFDHGCKEKVVLPTAPTSETSIATHWFQTLFHLLEPVNVFPGDIVKGTIKADRGKVYHREYKVQFRYGVVRKGSTQEPDYILREYTV